MDAAAAESVAPAAADDLYAWFEDAGELPAVEDAGELPAWLPWAAAGAGLVALAYLV